MRILAIETSCDETSLALLKGDGENITIEQNLVASQIDIHAKYGGVVPEVAARQHTEAIIPLLKEVGVDENGSNIDAIAVTAGPGLVPALRIGVAAAATLAWSWKKPIVDVNHLEGHLYSCFIDDPKPAFPAIGLLVSGGHTEIVLMRDHGEYELLGMTRDDAAGEAYDKAAKLMGLGYPGGPVIDKISKDGEEGAITFPRPMITTPDYDFSFSGLKTAVRVFLQENPDAKKEDVCHAFQEAVVDVLCTKTLKAVEQYKPKSVFLSGGVSANKRLRTELGDRLKNTFPEITYHVPAFKYCTDNAAMIAAAGYYRAIKRDYSDPLDLLADPSMQLD
jgi:N6-L-threonylcarbamoyladenine synthase